MRLKSSYSSLILTGLLSGCKFFAPESVEPLAYPVSNMIVTSLPNSNVSFCLNGISGQNSRVFSTVKEENDVEVFLKFQDGLKMVTEAVSRGKDTTMTLQGHVGISIESSTSLKPIQSAEACKSFNFSLYENEATLTQINKSGQKHPNVEKFQGLKLYTQP